MLGVLGLTPAEQGLYEVLVAHSSVTRIELTTLAADHGWGPDIDAALDRLCCLDLVTELPTSPARYVAAPPRPALEALLHARGREVTRAHQQMLRLAARLGGHPAGADQDELVEVVHGQSEIVRQLAEARESLTDELLSFDAPPFFKELQKTVFVRREDSLAGVAYRVVYDPRAVAIPPRVVEAATIDREVGHGIRVARLPGKMYVINRRLAILPLDNATHPVEALLLVRDPVLVAVLRALFEVFWDHAVPVGIANGLTERIGPDELPDPDRQLLSLLASGFTDRSSATRLGWSERAVNVRVRDMMHRLGAKTRFQAGYEAVARGWLSTGNTRAEESDPH